MFAKKHYLNREIWRRIRIPAIIIAFLCLTQFHQRERARVAEASMPPADAALPTALIIEMPDLKKPLIVEVEDLENFQATAYSVTGITKSGVPVEPGHVAADPKIIPLGSMIYVDSSLMSGIYQVTDTGKLIKGKIIDIFIPSYNKSLEFGRRKVKVKVLRYGFEDPDQKQAP